MAPALVTKPPTVMKTEKEKMIAGEPYFATDPQLIRERARSQNLCAQYNATRAEDMDQRRILLNELFAAETNVYIQPPFHCDYGTNIRFGANVYLNFNCIILDVAPVTIGNNTMFGPAVQIYTAAHPTDPEERRSGIEFGKPITIGSDIWIGGGSILCPGITIGDRCVIGAGSVVTKSIPPDSIAVGNPCRVIRTLAQ